MHKLFHKATADPRPHERLGELASFRSQDGCIWVADEDTDRAAEVAVSHRVTETSPNRHAAS